MPQWVASDSRPGAGWSWIDREAGMIIAVLGPTSTDPWRGSICFTGNPATMPTLDLAPGTKAWVSWAFTAKTNWLLPPAVAPTRANTIAAIEALGVDTTELIKLMDEP